MAVETVALFWQAWNSNHAGLSMATQRTKTGSISLMMAVVHALHQGHCERQDASTALNSMIRDFTDVFSETFGIRYSQAAHSLKLAQAAKKQAAKMSGEKGRKSKTELIIEHLLPVTVLVDCLLKIDSSRVMHTAENLRNFEVDFYERLKRIAVTHDEDAMLNRYYKDTMPDVLCEDADGKPMRG